MVSVSGWWIIETTMKAIDPTVLRDDPLLRRVWEQLGRPSRCRVTGGYVRDRLLGRSSRDLDLTIERGEGQAAGPARRLAAANGVRAHLLGTAPHRIWRIDFPSLKVEIWPLGGLTFEEDMKRRDFGCNALSWELPDGPLVDLVGGLRDLEQRLLRTTSRSNLEDDPVRLLRAPRFLAQFETFTLDPTTRRWIRELAPSLSLAPRARVGQELLTLLRGPSAARGLLACVDLGLARWLSPAAHPIDEGWLTENLAAADRLVSPTRHPLRRALETSGDAARLSFLFRAWGSPEDDRLTPYGWSRSDRANALRAARMLDDARETVDAPHSARRELAWRAGMSFPTLINLAAALDPGRPGWRRWWRQWQRHPSALEHPRPLLTGVEVAEIAGIEPGPELGTIARALLRAQVRGEVRSRGGAERWIRKNSPR